MPSRGLRRYKVIDQLAAHLAGVDGTVAQIARELLARCRELTVRINQLERDLRDLVQVLAPGLVAIPGCGVLAAATILGETAGATRFRSGMPLPASTAPPRSRCGQATACGCGSTAAATAPSTGRCT